MSTHFASQRGHSYLGRRGHLNLGATKETLITELTSTSPIPGLARSRPRDHQQRSIAVRTGCALRLVEGSIATSRGHPPNTRQMFSSRKIAMLGGLENAGTRLAEPASTSSKIPLAIFLVWAYQFPHCHAEAS
jgi:hypothetical protein